MNNSTMANLKTAQSSEGWKKFINDCWILLESEIILVNKFELIFQFFLPFLKLTSSVQLSLQLRDTKKCKKNGSFMYKNLT